MMRDQFLRRRFWRSSRNSRASTGRLGLVRREGRRGGGGGVGRLNATASTASSDSAGSGVATRDRVPTLSALGGRAPPSCSGPDGMRGCSTSASGASSHASRRCDAATIASSSPSLVAETSVLSSLLRFLRRASCTSESGAPALAI
eukprot:scaffold47951_cov31-Tisochrysis_lutea.AAC.1